MIQNQEIGFKIMPYDQTNTPNELFSKYSINQNDWSAIYIQKNPKHCMTYIYTKYELFKEVCLMKFTFNDQIKFILIDHPKISLGNISSKEKAIIVKEILRNNHNININDQPLLDALGLLNIGLIMEDSDQYYEYIVPHRLMQLSQCYASEILVKFIRHETKIFRTIKIVYQNVEEISEQYQDRIHEWPIPNL